MADKQSESTTTLGHFEPRVEGEPFDYLKTVHADYIRALERTQKLGDALQDDFKMFAVIMPLLTGAVAALSGVKKFGAIELAAGGQNGDSSWSFAFWAFAATVSVAAVIAFRDYIRAASYEYQLYTVARFERHYRRLVQDLVPPGGGEVVTPVEYFIAKFRKKFAAMTLVSSSVFILPIVIGPPVVLALTGNSWEAVALAVYAGVLLLAYAITGHVAFGRFDKMFRSLDALDRDDPEATPSPLISKTNPPTFS